jgi:hypothetical protein
MKKNTVLILAEILVMGGIVTAFIAPLLFLSDESSEVGVVRDRRVLTGDSFKV